MFRDPSDYRSDYHRLELSIATDPADPRRVMPHVEARHRRILDVGCGAGQTLIGCNLADSVLAVGVDPDHEALALGKELTSAVNFVLGRGESLPFENESFDLVLCRVALPYMHVATALAEMARVTAPAGNLWLVLHPLGMTVKELGTNLTHLQLKASLYRLWVLLNGLTLSTVGIQTHWPGNSRRYESWQTSGGIKRALVAAGFEQIRISRERHFVVTASKASLTPP
jgi:ubiquinone/menaquinone biosynthesis C-methylase UbiE